MNSHLNHVCLVLYDLLLYDYYCFYLTSRGLDYFVTNLLLLSRGKIWSIVDHQRKPQYQLQPSNVLPSYRVHFRLDVSEVCSPPRRKVRHARADKSFRDPIDLTVRASGSREDDIVR